MLNWKDPGPQIWRHASYGFSWQSSSGGGGGGGVGSEDGGTVGSGGRLSKASSGRVSSVADLLADNRGSYDRTQSLNSKRSRDDAEEGREGPPRDTKKSRSEPRVSFL